MSSPIKPGWRMTEDQHRLYFRLWNAVCAEMRWDVLPAKDRDEWRRELHRRAFGADKSAKDIDRLKEFDAIKAVFLTYLKPGDLRAQVRQADTHSAKILWKLEHELLPQLLVLLPGLPTARWAAMGVAHKYVAAISHNKYGTPEFSTLGAGDLQHLFYDVARTVQTKRLKAGITVAELNRRAGLGKEDSGEKLEDSVDLVEQTPAILSPLSAILSSAAPPTLSSPVL